MKKPPSNRKPISQFALQRLNDSSQKQLNRKESFSNELPEIAKAQEVIKRAEDLQKIKDELIADMMQVDTSHSVDTSVHLQPKTQETGHIVIKNQLPSPFRSSQKKKLSELVDEQIKSPRDIDPNDDEEPRVEESLGVEDMPPQASAVNDFSEPLASPKERSEAYEYGFSFNSKHMAQGPHFFNLRIMCQCLGSAIKKHIDFSRNDFWFLDDLNNAKENEKAFGFDKTEVEDIDQSGFSYHFPQDLKIPTDEKQEKERSDFKIQQEKEEQERRLREMKASKPNPFKPKS